MGNEELCITIETLSDELTSFYETSNMDRGLAGRNAIEWAFARNSAPFCIARKDNKIVGLSAYIQSSIKLGEDTGVAFQAIDSFVAPEMRGKGMFTRLATAYAEHAATTVSDLIWGFPNENAAPAWYGKLGWINHGQVPFLIKPLHAGYFLRKLKLFGNFPLSLARDENLQPLSSTDAWTDELWERYSKGLTCSIIRDGSFIEHRLFEGPNASEYRVVGDPSDKGGIVATREAEKHGGKIAYLMEAMGGNCLKGLLLSELARLRDRGSELVLAWSYPWSPNYRTLRDCGFLPFPERLRPTQIWFGGRSNSGRGKIAENGNNWYLSYLDSDTV